MANKKYNLEELKKERKNWPEPVPGSVELSVYAGYLLKKQAVDMYIDGIGVSQIQKTTGIYASRLTQLIDKCMESIDNGNSLGYCGLLKHTKKISDDALSHKREFSRLIEKWPSLKDFIVGNYFGDKKYTSEKNMNLITLHRKFLKECTRLGIMQHEYPFSTSNQGYVSLCSYIHQLEEQSITLQLKRLDKDNRQKLASTGQGERFSSNSLYPFSAVQVDGHIIDMLYTVEFPNTDGTVSSIVATRAWLIAVIDVATRCVLGYSVSQEFNYDQYDMIDAIKDAVVPKTLKDLTIPGLKYPSNGGYYSTAFPGLKHAVFDTIMLDNAKSHLSTFTLDKLINGIKCTVNYGSVATPETRGIVERFFETLETCGFHKLPMTTGSSTKDLKRKSPEKETLKYKVTYDQIVELMDVLIAQYNNTPHKGIDNLTPLECMRVKVFDAGMKPYIADDDMIAAIDMLNLRTEECYVRGHAKKGKRPYVQFMGTEYRSRILSSSETYVGQKIQIIYDPRDISTIQAYTLDGCPIGTLTARGEFGTKSHSVKTRKNAMKLARERGRSKLDFDTPIEAYMEHLKKEGRKSRRAATKADIVRREAGLPLPSEKKSEKNNVIELKKIVDTNKKLSSEDIKNLSTEELYSILFEERRS